jgi:hypothetical protein
VITVDARQVQSDRVASQLSEVYPADLGRGEDLDGVFELGLGQAPHLALDLD